MAKLKGELQADNGDILYPHTGSQVVFRPDGTTLEAGVQEIEQYYVDNRDKQTSIADIKIKGRTLVNLLGRSGNGIYQQSNLLGCSANSTIGFDGEYITLTNNETTTAGKILAITAFSGKAKVGSYYLFMCNKKSDSNIIGQVAFYGCTLLDYSWNTDNVCYGLYRFNGVDPTGASHIDMIIGEMKPNETAYIKNFRLYEISEAEAQSIKNKSTGFSTPKEINQKYPYVDDVKCIVNPYMESKENVFSDFTYGSYSANSKGDIVQGDPNYHICSSTKIFVPKGTYTATCKSEETFGMYVNFVSLTGAVSSIASVSNTSHTTFTTQADGYLYLFRHIDNNSAEVTRLIKELNLGKIKMSLVKGSTPKTYEECNNSRIMFETKLYSGETISRSNEGSYVKNSEWEEHTLDNVDIYNVYKASTGYTGVCFRDLVVGGKTSTNLESDIVNLVRYDGSIVTCKYNSAKNSEMAWIWDSPSYADLHLIIPNTLTGWGDNYTPTADEVKAFFLGWKMYTISSDNYALYNGTGTKYWAKLWCGIGEKQSALGTVSGQISNTCPTVMNDLGYTAYRLLYKKVTPTLEEVKTYGGLVVKEGVDVTVNSGLVLSESVVPFVSGAGYEVNPVANESNRYGHSHASNRFERLISVLDENYNHLKFVIRDLTSLNYAPNMINGGKVNAYVTDNLTTSRIIYDYLIYSPDTVTNFDCSIKTYDTVLDTLNKGNHELVATKEELANTKKELERAKVELSQRSNPNLLINGDFQVWQRGTSFSGKSTINCFTADRWKAYCSASSTSIDKTSLGVKLTYTGAVWVNFFQPMEVPKDLYNKVVTFSVKLRSTTDFKLVIQRALNNNIIVKDFKASSESKVFTATARLEELPVYNFNIWTYNGDGEMEIEWAKVEVGEYATPFVPRTYAEELSLCQRYYEVVNKYNIVGNAMYAEGRGQVGCVFKVQKRVVPTMSKLSNISIHYMGQGIQTVCSVGYNRNNLDGCRFDITPTTTVTTQVGRVTVIEDDIHFDAEIY